MLENNFLLNVDMLECIRKNTADVIFSSEKGTLIYDKVSKIYMMSTEEIKTAKLIIEKIAEDVQEIVSHQKFYNDLLIDKFNFTRETPCYNSVYTNKKAIEIENMDIQIKTLTEEYIEEIENNYSGKDLCSSGYVERRIKAGAMEGAFLDSKLCGFIGTHMEGSIGMLEVLPQYRGRGIGKALQAAAANKALEHGRYVYGQVVEGNSVSRKLQESLGFELSVSKVYWLSK
ncbi:GNAT family N-acetyltransferase [Clostridium sp. 19966]|uniref:GNAT family N-acetyltransferase n=1 Tax=Clostridium sp. 19966 TaxID=2768166 RepID=UPI0028DEC18B|nr:GNAT family N-acetyltransferase [Clostridium sp. 19966]MDT8716811.1 GNAT family N-acetyltransferase [Clostridium sp. 19966]